MVTVSHKTIKEMRARNAEYLQCQCLTRLGLFEAFVLVAAYFRRDFFQTEMTHSLTGV